MCFCCFRQNNVEKKECCGVCCSQIKKILLVDFLRKKEKIWRRFFDQFLYKDGRRTIYGRKASGNLSITSERLHRYANWWKTAARCMQTISRFCFMTRKERRSRRSLIHVPVRTYVILPLIFVLWDYTKKGGCDREKFIPVGIDIFGSLLRGRCDCSAGS